MVNTWENNCVSCKDINSTDWDLLLQIYSLQILSSWQFSADILPRPGQPSKKSRQHHQCFRTKLHTQPDVDLRQRLVFYHAVLSPSSSSPSSIDFHVHFLIILNIVIWRTIAISIIHQHHHEAKKHIEPMTNCASKSPRNSPVSLKESPEGTQYLRSFLSLVLLMDELLHQLIWYSKYMAHDFLGFIVLYISGGAGFSFINSISPSIMYMCVCGFPSYCFPFQASLGQVNQKASSHEILTVDDKLPQTNWHGKKNPGQIMRCLPSQNGAKFQPIKLQQVEYMRKMPSPNVEGLLSYWCWCFEYGLWGVGFGGFPYQLWSFPEPLQSSRQLLILFFH